MIFKICEATLARSALCTTAAGYYKRNTMLNHAKRQKPAKRANKIILKHKI